jgi:dienelactone hydrolase
VPVALALVAVHIVDDNFLQPQPGMSAGDHLVSGLVPLAVLLLAAPVYGRLRAGSRAAIAIFLGAFGIVIGASEAVYYSLKVGPSGDDYTGFVALGAGLLLVSVGAATLWKSRRRDDSLWWWRYLRRLLMTAGTVLAGWILVLPFFLSYGFTHVTRAAVPAARLGAPYQQVSFTTSDGLTLEGWYVPSRNRAAVIAFPGRVGPQKHARMLVRHGYGVLLFDRRGEGESDGEPNAYGWALDKDIAAAAAFLQRRPDVDRNRIGGIGLSVGGEMMLQAAAESNDLKAVVSEGAGSRSVREVIEKKAWFDIPTYAVLTAGTALFSNQAPPPNLKDLVGRIAPRSVFFIYSTHGVDGEEKQLNPKYYAAAGEPKQSWEIPEASHTGGIVARPKEYERRVIGFFDRALLGKG